MTEFTNKIYCGDNLEIMPTLPDDFVDLIYLDPPFFSGRNYEVIWGDKDEVRSFEDRWEGGINHYVTWMVKRLHEMHRILKPTGSIYLHCDWHASHYLKIEMDKIFGYNNFRNEIVWKRTNRIKGTSNDYGNVNDTILFYTKHDGYIFNRELHELSEKNIKRDYKNIEKETMRLYNHGGMLKQGNSPKKLFFRDKNIEITAPEGKRFVWSQETYDEIFSKNNLCIHWSNNGTPRYKIYLDEHKGIPVTNLWDDIDEISTLSAEKLGYPTQKPEALIERIIKASSNTGDIVFDPFCGCGTTVAVADRLQRYYIGIDISPAACGIIAKRVSYSEREIIGLPVTIEDIKKMKPHEFQQWICDKMLAKNTSKSKDKPSGGDGGKDGIVSHNLNTGIYGGSPIQVKQSEGVGVNVVRNLFATMHDMKVKKGFIIGFSFSSGAVEQVAKYKLEDSVEIILIEAEKLCSVKNYTYSITKSNITEL